MKLHIFGSCRVWDLAALMKVTILNDRTLMHDVSQYIQEIRFYKRIIDIPEKFYDIIYCNSYIKLLLSNKETLLDKNLMSLDKADIVLIEICTLKYLIHDNYTIDFNQTKKTSMSEKINIDKYDKDLFVQKINELVNLIPNKKIVFIGHIFNPDLKIVKLEVRQTLNQWLSEIVSNIPNAYFFDPSICVMENGYYNMMVDGEHYSKKGQRIMKRRLRSFLLKIK